MRNIFLAPILALVAGGVGFALRRWELATAFEPNGVSIEGVPASMALIALSVMVTVILVVLCRGNTYNPRDPDTAFAAHGNTLYLTAMVLAGFAMLAAGVLNVLGLSAAYNELLRQAAETMSQVRAFSLAPRIGLALCTFGSAWGFISTGRRHYQGRESSRYSMATLVPAYGACLLLISVYQERASSPVVLDYMYELFACVLCALGTYFIAGFSFDNGRGFLATFSGLLATYFLLVTLADSHQLYVLLLLVGFFLYLIASSTVLLTNRPQGDDASRRDSYDTMTDREEPTHEG